MAGFFGLFDYNRPGPGVRKDEPEKKGAARYFDILGKRIWKFISLNFLYVVFSVIPFLILYTICSVCSVIVLNLCFGFTADRISGLMENGGTLLTLLSALFIYCLGGGGACACGLINVLRKYVDDTHAWVWQDFIDGFKTNFVQGTIAYIIDCLAVGVLIFNLGFYFGGAEGYVNFSSFYTGVGASVIAAVLQGVFMLIAFVWALMHVYIYPTMTTFKFGLKDIYKNSLIMALGKLPKTLTAFFFGGIIAFAVSALSAAVLYFALLIPIILFALCEYSRLTISYPLIKKYMLDPETVKEEKRLESMRRDIRADSGAVFSDERVEGNE